MLIGQDLEPGRIGKARFSHNWNFVSNKELGKINDEELTYRVGLNIGRFCKELGVHVNFAPVADVNNNPDNPVINDRSFSDNPEIVTRHAIAFACGLHDAGIIACAKHFPGHGDTSTDSHQTLPMIDHDKERLHAIELHSFKALINENIPAIMIGHLEVPAFELEKDLPSTLSKNIVTELLQKELGFTGLIITDALDMHGITDFYCKKNLQSHLLQDSQGKVELDALCAGNDILLCPVNVPAAVTAIKQAINDNIITEKEIDAHVEKILHIKNLIFYIQ